MARSSRILGISANAGNQNMNISLRKQPSDNTNVSTCIAMIANDDVNTVLFRSNVTPPFSKFQIIGYLVRRNIYPELIVPIDYSDNSAVYLAIISDPGPFPRGVVIETDASGVPTLFDPDNVSPYTDVSQVTINQLWKMTYY